MSRLLRRPFVHLFVPLAILIVLAAPSVTFLLPATEDHLDEIYQPLQALKFFKTRGKAFHKYPPLPNFILAPGYGVSLAYWKVTGAFGNPSEDFQYGFSRPIEQMGVLILQGRVIFLVIGVAALAYFAHAVQLVTKNRAAVGFALLFCVASNYAVAMQLPSPRPDSPMLAFSALALACYVRMLFLGLSVRRGVWMSLWAVAAISSKELAAPMFVMPYLGVIWLAWREGDAQPGGRHESLRTIRWSFVAGVVAYALINVVYAPSTWMRRMAYWISGPGVDAEVWGGAHASMVGKLSGAAQVMLDNLGLGGTVVTAVALAAYLVVRPSRWVLLILPAMSVSLLGLSQIMYPADRFYAILCLALFPVVAAGLGAVLDRWTTPAPRRAAIGLLVLLGVMNVWWGTFAWHVRHGVFEYVAERHVQSVGDRSAKYAMFQTYAWPPGGTRIDWLGFRHDPRPIQQIAASGKKLPDWIYATRGKLLFFEEARTMPRRAAQLRDETRRSSGQPFEAENWRGLEGLGYRLHETIVPETPAWFPFNWMPAVKQWKPRMTVLVYRREGPATTNAGATTTPS